MITMIDVIAHRGLRHERPENSLEAIAAALELSSVHGVEFDVELTRDGVPMVLHQETVVPNAAFTCIEPAARNCTSRDWVIEHSAHDIAALDAGSWMGAEFSHVRVATLSEVFELPWNSKTAYVELKDATFWAHERDTSRPARVVEAALAPLLAFQGAVNVISFNPEILRILRARAPHIPTTLALWTEWRSRAVEAVAEARRCGASTLSLPDLVVLKEPEWVQTAHEHGIKIHVYPVSPARGEPEFNTWTSESQISTWRNLRQLGVDAIISDFARETALDVAI
jgi:glycerophosphoryl diester phosphodiesterase